MNVLLTGGSRGLGFETSKEIVSQGHNLCITSRNIDTLYNAYSELNKIKKHRSQKITWIQCDVSTDADMLFTHFMNIFGEIDVLINNAATYGELGKLENVEIEKWIYAIETNLIAPVRLTKLAIPFMKEKNKGKIIQISGGGATAPLSNMSAYATSKAAVVRFVECMAMELKDYNIDINAIAPGIMKTDLIEQVINNESKVEKNYYNTIKNYNDFSFSHPVELIMFLMSEESDGITGRLVSAKYDNWKEFSEHKDDVILHNDAYTLRRTNGKQFGFDWDNLGAK